MHAFPVPQGSELWTYLRWVLSLPQRWFLDHLRASNPRDLCTPSLYRRGRSCGPISGGCSRFPSDASSTVVWFLGCVGLGNHQPGSSIFYWAWTLPSIVDPGSPIKIEVYWKRVRVLRFRASLFSSNSLAGLSSVRLLEVSACADVFHFRFLCFIQFSGRFILCQASGSGRVC